MPLSRPAKLLAAGFLASGTIHLVKPEVYEPLMPAWVPAHREVILGSGVAEIAIAGAMAAPRTRRLGGWAAVALLLGVWPGNLKMAADATKTRSTAYKVVAVGRVPLQIPMLRIALGVARGR